MSFRATETDSRREPKTEGLRLAIAYFVEVAPDDYHLTADRTEATHGLIDTTGLGDWEIVPIESTDGSVFIRRIGSDRYFASTIQSSVPDALQPGSITVTGGVGVVTIAAATAPTGGSGSYTVSLYRSTDGSRGTLLASGVTLPYDDATATAGVEHFYTAAVSDGTSTEDTAQASATPLPVADIYVSPEDDLAAALAGAAEGSTIYLLPGTHSTGELAGFADNLEIFGPTATLTSVTRSGITAYTVTPLAIVHGTGANTFNLNQIDGTYLHDLGISGGVYAADGQTGNGVMHGSNTIMRRVKVFDTDKAGLSGLLVNLLMEDCEITGNGIGQYSGLSSGLKTTRFVTLRRVYCHANHYYGLWCDCQCPGWTIEDCIVENNYGSGIFNEISIGPALFDTVYLADNNTGGDAGRSDLVVTSSEDVTITGCVFGTASGRVAWLREDNRAGLGTPGDKDDIGETNACDYGHRLDEITVSGCDFGNGQVRLQWDNGVSTLVDPTVDASHVNPNDVTSPQSGVTFIGNS